MKKERKEDTIEWRRRQWKEEESNLVSGLGWYVIRRTMGGRNEGSSGRSHRRNSAGTWPSQIRQEQQPNPVEPPRWFTARRKLVKFKSAFKTGLARCPAPPGAATAGKRYRRAPTGVYRSNILGKLWMDFPPQATATVLAFLASLHPSLAVLPSRRIKRNSSY